MQVNTGMMAQIKKSDPELYTAAVVKDGGQAFSTEILKRNLQRALPEAERRTKLAQLEHRLATNPYDVEAQKLLEEEIERQNIANNMELALEHMPEAFGSVCTCTLLLPHAAPSLLSLLRACTHHCQGPCRYTCCM